MAYQYVPLPEGLLCLPAQAQEHGGVSRRPAGTRGELDRAVKGPYPISTVDKPYKMTSSRPITAHRYLTVLNLAPYQASLRQDGGQNMVLSSGSFTSPLPASGQGLGRRSGRQSSAAPVPPNTYPAHSYQVSVIIPSPDLRLSPHRPQCSEDSSPDLECSICFSQFNNVFRCPKMLQCKHTFCLECLARINVKSAQPSAIQCPLCRSLTLLPALGLPRLATDSDVLAYLPPDAAPHSVQTHEEKIGLASTYLMCCGTFSKYCLACLIPSQITG
uniref:RING-type domain-containing protein n=1 Tax=Mola mola TaxID=94237 RepID=A0A3Q3WNH5_MOLML